MNPITDGWKATLEAGPQQSMYTDIVRQASNWQTCAVGELLDFPPNDCDVIDDVLYAEATKLRRLGIAFSEAIKHAGFEEALRIWEEINDPKFDALAEDLKNILGEKPVCKPEQS